VVLGLYYATRDRINGKGEGLVFADTGEVQRALDAGEVELAAKDHRAHDRVDQGQGNGRIRARPSWWKPPWAVHCCPRSCPRACRSRNMNKALKKKEISKLINVSFRKCGLKETVVFADKLLQNGFRLATRAGISICHRRHAGAARKRPASSSAPRRK
jgi:DNA-directed RNA polymerase subunit beta'